MKTLLGSMLIACLVAALAPAPVASQDAGSRYRVLIPWFEPLDGADDDFGEDASDELRDLISTLITHEAMSEDDIEDEARNFDLDMDELGCAPAIQIASQLSVPVVVCATYSATADRGWIVNARVRNVVAGEDFVLDEIRVPRDDADELAAQEIFSQFDRYNNLVRASGFCADYAASRQFEQALGQCDAALAISADATSTRFLRAQILRELERNEESLEETLRVLGEDPYHELALQNAGYLSALADDDEAARDYYGRYLEINPGDVGIRMRIAYDLARAGDPVGAMELVAEGLEVDTGNPDLWDQYGGFAFRAGQDAQIDYQRANPDAEDLAPEAAEFFRDAIEAYGQLFAARGADTPADRLRNVLRAHLQIGEDQAAVDAAGRFVQTHPDDAPLWSLLADAQHRLDLLDDALATLERVAEIDPEYPNLSLRRGSWLLEARMVDAAIATLADAAERSAEMADQAARMVWNEGYQNGYQIDDFAYAINMMMAAKQFPNLSETMVHQLNFWHGHSLMRSAIPEQRDLTLASAEATLPKFREALDLVRASGDYADTVGMDLESQVVQPIQQYIDIQEAIIQRGY
jgi:tetratricopeptide (TPR) repeat protein